MGGGESLGEGGVCTGVCVCVGGGGGGRGGDAGGGGGVPYRTSLGRIS